MELWFALISARISRPVGSDIVAGDNSTNVLCVIDTQPHFCQYINATKVCIDFYSCIKSRRDDMLVA